eukprot:scaffold2821_cov134-Isochrysis_galbana.AAC.2
MLAGREILLADDATFDGAAWDMISVGADVLALAKKKNNLLLLPAGEMRVIQFIYDAHGWNSVSGATRFILRTPQTIVDHNVSEYGEDFIFYVGADKYLYLVKAFAIGGEKSLKARLEAGLVVERDDPPPPLPRRGKGKQKLTVEDEEKAAWDTIMCFRCASLPQPSSSCCARTCRSQSSQVSGGHQNCDWNGASLHRSELVWSMWWVRASALATDAEHPRARAGGWRGGDFILEHYLVTWRGEICCGARSGRAGYRLK